MKERGIAELILRAEASKRVDAAIRDAVAWPTKVRGAVDTLSQQLPAPTITRPDGTPNQLNAILTTLANATTAAVAQLQAAIATAQHDLEAPWASWQALFEAERKEINAALAVEKIYDMAEIDQDQHRIVVIEGLLGKLQTARAEAARIDAQRTALLHELADVRRRQSRLVERAAAKLTSAVGARVRVHIEPLADRQALHALLAEAVKGQGVQREQLNKLSRLPPATIAEAIWSSPGGLQKLGLSPGTASRFADLPAQMIRKIEECATPDSIVIEIDLGSPAVSRWTPIEQASPGQRSTAMLALALSSGDEPLIIDQPEDDLDNRFIYDEVVKILSLVCRSRQVIVATHNANIPILGDAELIIALDAAAAKASILACGGLEDPHVADCARHILEGGDEAFRARHNRYQAAGK